MSDGTSLTGFSPQQLIAPGVLATFGLVTHYFAHDTWDWGISSIVSSKERPFPLVEDYIQYAPVVMELSLGAVGVKTRHGF